jgi:hypothetical protein
MRTSFHAVFRLALLALLSLSLSGCGLIDKIKGMIGFAGGVADDLSNEVTAELDQAINSLSATSADFQIILQDLISQLPAEVQSTIGTEVNGLMVRGAATVGTELRCNTDFLRTRIRQGLVRIKVRFLGGVMPPLEPQLCQVVPLAVDMKLSLDRRNKIEFYGYDFDSTDVRVFLQNGSSEIDVTRHLSRPTHYHMVLNLSSNGVNLSASSNRLILRWAGREISSIPVLQQAPDICEVSQSPSILNQSLSFVPPHTRGDREYAGHGPDVYASVTFRNLGDRVDAVVYMSAEEVGGDHTTAAGQKSFTIYSAPPGKRILSIIGPDFADHRYRDDDLHNDEFPGGGLISSWKFVGDTGGDDVGETRVEAFLNPFKVELKENTDCVEPSRLSNLLNLNQLSTVTVQSLRNKPRFNTVQEFRNRPSATSVLINGANP